MATPASDGPALVHVTYRPHPGRELALQDLIQIHEPLLRRLGLLASRPVQHLRLVDRQGAISFVEILEWRDARAADEAHQSPEVMALWGRMEPEMAEIVITQAAVFD